MEQPLWEALKNHGIKCSTMGMDSDHVHFILDIGIRGLPDIIKKLKGYTGKRILQEYPWLKRRYFWKSGFWNPSYYADSIGRNKEQLTDYVRRQGMPKNQSTLTSFVNN